MIVSLLTLILINQLVWLTTSSQRQRNRINELEQHLEATTSDFTTTQVELSSAHEELTILNDALLQQHQEHATLKATLQHHQMYGAVLKALLGGLITRHPHIYTTEMHQMYNGFIRHELPRDFFNTKHQHRLYDQTMPAHPLPVDQPSTALEDI